MTDTRPTIDEQIAHQRHIAAMAGARPDSEKQKVNIKSAILASLEELKRIQSAEMPEPVAIVGEMGGINPTTHGCITLMVGDKIYGPELLAYAQRKDAEAREQRELTDEWRKSAPLCDEHKPNGGTRGTCLVCACIKLSAALSRCDYYCDKPNEQEVSGYDIHCDQDAVVANVKKLYERAESLSEDNVKLIAENEVLRKDAEDCICKTNLRQIIKESTPNLGKTYIDREGNECVFFGVVWGDDDLYYGMFGKDNKATVLLSCVGGIECFGYTLKNDAAIDNAMDEGRDND